MPRDTAFPTQLRPGERTLHGVTFDCQVCNGSGREPVEGGYEPCCMCGGSGLLRAA